VLASGPAIIRESSTVPKYVLFGSYCEDVLEKRTPYRQAHLDRIQQLKEQGIVVTLGPTKDLTKVFGVYDAPDEVTAQKLIEEDPYWQAEIWTEYTVKEWIQAF
jgi:uncharacterized protein